MMYVCTQSIFRSQDQSKVLNLEPLESAHGWFLLLPQQYSDIIGLNKEIIMSKVLQYSVFSRINITTSFFLTEA